MVPLSDFDELLKTPKPERMPLTLEAIAPVRIGHFAHVDVAARVDRKLVRRDELTQLEPGGALAEARQELALVAVDAHARADVGHVVVHTHAAADLADVEAALGSALHE